MKRNVYLAMKGAGGGPGNIFQFVADKKTLPEEINTEDALGRVTAGPVFAGFPHPLIIRLPWTGCREGETTYGASSKPPKF